MAFGGIKIPFRIATHFPKYAATSSLKNKQKAAAFGVVSALPYYHNGTSAIQLMDASSAQTLSNKINGDQVVLAATATFTSTITAATLTGFSWTVVAAGTYIFDAELFTTMTTNGGGTVSFKLTTAVLASIRYNAYASTATDNSTAVSVQGTTTTDATKVFDSKTAAYTRVRVNGSMVVTTGGTFAWQVTQNTSNTDTTSFLIGSYGRLTRTA